MQNKTFTSAVLYGAGVGLCGGIMLGIIIWQLIGIYSGWYR